MMSERTAATCYLFSAAIWSSSSIVGTPSTCTSAGSSSPSWGHAHTKDNVQQYVPRIINSCLRNPYEACSTVHRIPVSLYLGLSCVKYILILHRSILMQTGRATASTSHTSTRRCIQRNTAHHALSPSLPLPFSPPLSPRLLLRTAVISVALFLPSLLGSRHSQRRLW